MTGVYIHIPYCVKKCAYCDFCSVPRDLTAEAYPDALCREIALSRDRLPDEGPAPSVFFGGGTPTALPAPLLRRALQAAAPLMAACREITVEAGRPDTIDAEKLGVLRESGVTRISVNPQTMHDETLERIGRRHTAGQTEAAYRLAREMGFHHINMDLIAGLPGEDGSMFEQTLRWAAALRPESLTVHTLSIKRSSLLHLWQAQLPDGAMVADMVRAGADAAR